MSALLVLFWIAVVLWTIWFISYPVYKKIKKEKIHTLNYVLGLNMGAITVNTLNLIMIIIRVMN